MINISAFGLRAAITASNTFPNGFSISAFADDADPMSTPDLDAADTAMALNGDMIVWTRPQGIEVNLAVIPSSPDDTNLDILLNANRISKGKQSARDLVSIVLTYPNGVIATFNSGIIVSAPVAVSVSSNGRLKTRNYKFKFEQITKSGQ